MRQQAYIGEVSILIGMAFWTVNAVGVERPEFFGPGGLNSYVLLVLSPLGILFIVSGVGMLLYVRRLQGTVSTAVQPGDLENDRSIPLCSSSFSLVSVRLGVVAFLEGIVIVSLYAGVIDEYRSNLIMQDWVRRTLPTMQILLSYEMLIAVSGILGLLVLQFLPGRRFHIKSA